MDIFSKEDAVTHCIKCGAIIPANDTLCDTCKDEVEESFEEE
jgi:hypothetical protein